MVEQEQTPPFPESPNPDNEGSSVEFDWEEAEFDRRDKNHPHTTGQIHKAAYGSDPETDVSGSPGNQSAPRSASIQRTPQPSRRRLGPMGQDVAEVQPDEVAREQERINASHDPEAVKLHNARVDLMRRVIGEKLSVEAYVEAHPDEKDRFIELNLIQ